VEGMVPKFLLQTIKPYPASELLEYGVCAEAAGANTVDSIITVNFNLHYTEDCPQSQQ
jgi:hypothetical protein